MMAAGAAGSLLVHPFPRSPTPQPPMRCGFGEWVGKLRADTAPTCGAAVGRYGRVKKAVNARYEDHSANATCTQGFRN